MKFAQRFLYLFLLPTLLGGSLLLPQEAVSAGDGSASDLISAVNDYRNSYGLSSLEVNSYLMAAAQSQADYLAATYDIGSGANGHVGAGGSNATDRAYAFGYGGGKAITVSENWVGTATLSASELPTCSYWADSAHQNTMLDGWGSHYQDIGVGVSTNAEGVKFFVMDVGVTDEKESYSASGDTFVDPAVVNGTAAATYVFHPLVTSTPQADGSVVHVVQYGETLITIAQSYGVKVDQIRELNYMEDGWTAIYEGEKLLIKAKGSTTPAVTVPSSAVTASPTTAATYTPRAVLTSTPLPTIAITVQPTVTPTSETSGFSTRSLGMVLLVVCGLGLVGVVGSSFLKHR